MGMGLEKLRFKDSQQTIDEGPDPDVTVESARLYECVRQPDDLQIMLGTKVRLVDMKADILVFSGTKPIGYVAPGQDSALRADVPLAERKGRSITASVLSVSDTTPSFFVKLEG